MSNEFYSSQYWKLPLPDFSELTKRSRLPICAKEKSETCRNCYNLSTALPLETITAPIQINSSTPCPLGTGKWKIHKNQYLSEVDSTPQVFSGKTNEQKSFPKCDFDVDKHSDEINICTNNKLSNDLQTKLASSGRVEAICQYNNNNSNNHAVQLHSCTSSQQTCESVNSMGNKESRAQKHYEASEDNGIKRRSRRHRVTNEQRRVVKQSSELENDSEAQDELTAAINELRCFDPSLQLTHAQLQKSSNDTSETDLKNEKIGFNNNPRQKADCLPLEKGCFAELFESNQKRLNCKEFLKNVMKEETFSEKSLIGWLSSGCEGNDDVLPFVKKFSEDLVKSGLLIFSKNEQNKIIYSWNAPYWKKSDPCISTNTSNVVSGDETTENKFESDIQITQSTPRSRARHRHLQRANSSDQGSTQVLGIADPIFEFNNKTLDSFYTMGDISEAKQHSSLCDISCQTLYQTFCVATQTPSVLHLMKAVQTCYDTPTTCDAACQSDIPITLSNLSENQENLKTNITEPIPVQLCVNGKPVHENVNIPPPPSAPNIPPPPSAPNIPPPPSAPSIPPPPPPAGKPPPPSMFRNSVSTPQSPSHETKPLKPMKQLYWTRVGKAETIVEKTLWRSVPSAQLDHTELTDLFCRKISTKKSVTTANKTISPTKKIKPAKLLSTKRSQALGIFISSLHVDVEDVKHAVLNLETTVVDVESISAVYDLRPQENELAVIKSFLKKQSKLDNDKKQPLDKPEDFLARLWDVDHCTDRLFCITFMSQFQCDLTDLQNNIFLIDNACKALRQDSIQQLFGIILAIGNYLNAGNKTRGEAAGFGLDVLSKLKDVKGNADNLNLLSYVLRVYIKTFDQNVEIASRKCPVPSTLQMIRASQVNYDDVNKHFQKLRKDLNVCTQRVDEVKLNATIHAEPFASVMDQFVTKATSEVKNLQEKIAKSREGYDDTLAYFGVKSTKNFSQKEFFDHWIRFCGDVTDMWTSQLKEILKAQKETAKQKVEEIRSKSSSVVVRARRRPRSLKSRLSAHIATDST